MNDPVDFTIGAYPWGFSVPVWLKHCAYCIHEGFPLDRTAAPPGWTEWICLTLPDADEWDQAEVDETRVMRFLLAAAMARDP